MCFCLHFLQAAEIHEMRKRMGSLQGELDHKNKYLQDLTFYFNNMGIDVPSSSREMQRAVRKHLKLHLKQRPSMEQLYSRNIMPDEFILRQRGVNIKNFELAQKDVYEANKRLHFRSKSKMVEKMMRHRPTYEDLTSNNIIREVNEEENENNRNDARNSTNNNNNNNNNNHNLTADDEYFDATNQSYDPEMRGGNIYDSNNMTIGRSPVCFAFRLFVIVYCSYLN